MKVPLKWSLATKRLSDFDPLVLRVNGCYEDRLTTMKHIRSIVLRDVMKIGWPSRGTWMTSWSK